MGSIRPAVPKTKETRKFSVATLKSKYESYNFQISSYHPIMLIVAYFISFNSVSLFSYVSDISVEYATVINGTHGPLYNNTAFMFIFDESINSLQYFLDIISQLLQSSLEHPYNKPEYFLYEKIL